MKKQYVWKWFARHPGVFAIKEEMTLVDLKSVKESNLLDKFSSLQS
jgi:hypothetical protein